MFQLGEIIPINFYIEAYGKYKNSSIMWTLIDFSANSSGRKFNIIILIHILIRNLNFTMEKLRKQHIFQTVSPQFYFKRCTNSSYTDMKETSNKDTPTRRIMFNIPLCGLPNGINWQFLQFSWNKIIIILFPVWSTNIPNFKNVR